MYFQMSDSSSHLLVFVFSIKGCDSMTDMALAVSINFIKVFRYKFCILNYAKLQKNME